VHHRRGDPSRRGFSNFWLAAQKPRLGTNAAPDCAPQPITAQRGKAPLPWLFQIRSRLHQHQDHNTNFTDFEAGVADFFHAISRDH
jgi:hypothetical protein